MSDWSRKQAYIRNHRWRCKMRRGRWDWSASTPRSGTSIGTRLECSNFRQAGTRVEDSLGYYAALKKAGCTGLARFRSPTYEVSRDRMASVNEDVAGIYRDQPRIGALDRIQWAGFTAVVGTCPTWSCRQSSWNYRQKLRGRQGMSQRVSASPEKPWTSALPGAEATLRTCRLNPVTQETSAGSHTL